MKHMKRIFAENLISCLAFSFIICTIIALIASLTSCGVRLDADGSKEFSVDSAAFGVALQILAEK